VANAAAAERMNGSAMNGRLRICRFCWSTFPDAVEWQVYPDVAHR
jgi:hypothetical protein